MTTRFEIVLSIVAASVLAGCVTIAKPVVRGGSCVPVTCPVGTLDIGLWPKAARVDGNDVTLLMSRFHHPGPSSVVVGNGDEFIKVSGFGQVRGEIAAAAPVSDGFVVVMSPDVHDIYARDPHHGFSREPISMEVSHVVAAHVEWTQPLVTSAYTRAPEDGLALTTTTDEFALAYLVDNDDRWDNAFTVERRSIASGELIERTTYSDATSYASLDLAYTERGLVFVWSPSGYLFGSMFMAIVGEPAETLPRSSNNGSVALLSSGAIAVERPWLHSGRVRVDGRSFARLSGRYVHADGLAMIESEVGTAVAFLGSEVTTQNRMGLMMIIGDGGVGLRLENEPQLPGGDVTLPLDRARLLHAVELGDQVELSILGCAGSSAVDGFACETPEQLTL